MKAQYKDPVFANPDFLQAIQNSDFEAVKDLVINHGADVNALDNYRVPVLVSAIYSQNAQIIDFFLAQGALVNPEYDNVAITPLGVACIVASMADTVENINDTFVRLINLGADLNPANCLSSPLTEIIKANGPCSDIMASYLVQNYKADINPTIDSAITPLVAATKIAINTFSLDPIMKCIALGAQINPTNNTQTSPLVASIHSGGPVAKIIASYLIEHGAKVESADATITCSPLHEAARYGQKEIYDLLVSKGANVNLKINDVCSFEQALKVHNFEMAEYIFTNFSKNIPITKDIFKFCMNFQQPKLLELFKEQGFDYTSVCAQTIKHSTSKIIQAVINNYGEYPPSEHPQFQYGEFIIRTLHPEYGYEGDRPDNTNDKKVTCSLQAKDGIFFDKNKKVFSTAGDEENSTPTENLWVVDPKGRFYTCTTKGEISGAAVGNQHSFFSKKDGFGKPIAGGGHIEIKEGKITKIDNCSGHYRPSKDQMILVVKYLHELGVLSEDIKIECKIKHDVSPEPIFLKDILLADYNNILSQYPKLEINHFANPLNIDNNVDLNIEGFLGSELNNYDSQISGNNSNLNEFDG